MAFQQGLSGLNSSSKALDVAGNNIANASTVGFKSSATHFADVYGASLQGGGGSQIGIGSTLGAVMQQYTQGNITSTNNPLDIAINGTGFFGLTQNGSVSYSRNGQFHLDKDGFIINDQNRKLLGVLADSTGSIPQQPPTDQLKVDFVTGTPNPTSTAALTANLDSRQKIPDQAPFDPTDPDTYNSSTAMTVYDSLGNPHTLSYYFVKSATANQWDAYMDVDAKPANYTVTGGGATVTLDANQQLYFTSSGTLDTTAPAPATTTPFVLAVPAVDPGNGRAFLATGASALTFNINVSNLTQFGSPFAVNDLTQNGFAPGNLAGVSVSKDGIVQARYDNGQTRDIGQVALFNFRNPNGLSSIGNNQWSETADSGQPTPGNPNAGIFGVLQASAVEESNVDLTAELVNLIVQQRNYQASAQSIKTQDQILQTLVNIR
ncbi:MAG: flagellar hook protein FlgE [Ferribacterium limneticum]